MSLKIKKITPDAKLPFKATEFSAGYDLFSNEDIIIEPSERALICTDLQISIPNDHYGRIAPRSSLAVKYSIDIGAGVIDSDYTGHLKILLINNGKEAFIVNKHHRIAQLIIEKISRPEIIEVDDLSSTERGDKGFGSTGNK